MPKKIALIISSLGSGGAEKVCVTIANGLVERGYAIDLIVLTLNGATRDKELSSKVNLINLRVNHARFSASALWRYLVSNNPRTVLSFNRQISVVLGLVRKLTGIKFRLVSRNITFLSAAESNRKDLWHGIISKFLTKKFYILSDVIIAQSEKMKYDLISYLNFPKNRIEVIYNPICQLISNFVNENNINDIANKEYLLCVGRLESVKAFHYAITAFAAIVSDYPALRLKIVGEGSLKEVLKEQSKRLGVSDRVDFEGYQNDIIPYYLHAKATLLTSLYEGFPNVLVESVALGTPVVSFDCKSGPSEIVLEGINGYLVRFQDEDHLAQCICKVLSTNLSGEEILKTAKRFNTSHILNSYERCL